jgi:hypothetical protein
MYAQFATIARGGNLDDAIQRAFGLQEFQHEYAIMDNLQDGQRQMHRLIELYPLDLLSFSYCHDKGAYILIRDVAKYDSTAMTTASQVNSYMAAAYYLHTTMRPDTAAIRRGCIILMEWYVLFYENCDSGLVFKMELTLFLVSAGMEWSKKQDFKIVRNMFCQLFMLYPFDLEVKQYHTGVVQNIMMSMLKPFMPDRFRKTFTTGLSFEGTLDTYYMVPDVATSNQRLLARLTETLKRHYENEKAFSL